VDSPGSGWEPVAGSCQHSDEPSGSGTTYLVTYNNARKDIMNIYEHSSYLNAATNLYACFTATDLRIWAIITQTIY
jgi:hypothetical protein